MKQVFTLIVLMVCLNTYCQKAWESMKYHYTLETPKGYTVIEPIGLNVDYKAQNTYSVIVIVVKPIPPELQDRFSGKTIFDMLGDLKTFEIEYIKGANEHLANPKFVKSGKTTVARIPAYWIDFTTYDPINRIFLYNKNYQFKLNSLLYTITFTCEQSELSIYQPVWFRFINSITPR